MTVGLLFVVGAPWTGWLCLQKAYAESVSIPVHSLPHSCNTHGFPQVMEFGVLGCFKDGRTGLWMDEKTRQTEELPAENWARGSVLFQSGIASGMWALQAQTWAVPSRRIADMVPEGQLYATKEFVLWVDEQMVHQLDLQTNQRRGTEANPLQGTHPVSVAKQVAWIEWGKQMGIHLWSPSTDTHTWIASRYPSSLVYHDSQLVWVSEGVIVVWSPDTKKTVRAESKVQEVFSTERGLCWTQWLTDIDIVCDWGFRLQRLGHQTNPVWKGESLYFTESDTLWVYKSIGQ